jgi:biopolymer transport protein ExbD
MRIPTQVRESGLRFNLTPLIDVVFLLIIFFLVASYIAGTENHADIELAEARSGDYDKEESPRRIVVTVTAEGTLQVSGKVVGDWDFEQLLNAERGPQGKRPLEVWIRADRRVPYQVVEPLLLACARAGVTKVKFPTTQPKL